jgi:hypothetical protein
MVFFLTPPFGRVSLPQKGSKTMLVSSFSPTLENLPCPRAHSPGRKPIEPAKKLNLSAFGRGILKFVCTGATSTAGCVCCDRSYIGCGTYFFSRIFFSGSFPLRGESKYSIGILGSGGKGCRSFSTRVLRSGESEEEKCSKLSGDTLSSVPWWRRGWNSAGTPGLPTALAGILSCWRGIGTPSWATVVSPTCDPSTSNVSSSRWTQDKEAGHGSTRPAVSYMPSSRGQSGSISTTEKTPSLVIRGPGRTNVSAGAYGAASTHSSTPPCSRKSSISCRSEYIGCSSLCGWLVYVFLKPSNPNGIGCVLILVIPMGGCSSYQTTPSSSGGGISCRYAGQRLLCSENAARLRNVSSRSARPSLRSAIRFNVRVGILGCGYRPTSSAVPVRPRCSTRVWRCLLFFASWVGGLLRRNGSKTFQIPTTWGSTLPKPAAWVLVAGTNNPASHHASTTHDDPLLKDGGE